MERFLNGYEVSLTKKQQEYEAKCLLCPTLVGKGKTEEEALNHLAKEITANLIHSIEALVTKMFNSNNYTEILFDHTTETPSQNRFYTIDPAFSATKSFILKLDQVNKEKKDEQNNLISSLINKDLSVLKNLMPSVSSDDGGSIQTLQKLIQNEDEGFSFGFPVSFN